MHGATSSSAATPSDAASSASAVPTAVDMDSELSLPPLPLFSASSEAQEPSQAALLSTDASTDTLDSALASALGPTLGSTLETRADELLQWMRACPRASHDDALFFFETRCPELLADLPLLFAWLALFLEHHPAAVSPTDATDGCESTAIHLSPVVMQALRQLQASGDLGAVAADFALKSPLTLLFWKHELDKQPQLTPTAPAEQPQDAKPRTAFPQEQELLNWVLAHRQTPLTKQDVLVHVQTQYPAFASAKSPAALKIWTARFLKRHISRADARGAQSTPEPPQHALQTAPESSTEVATAAEASRESATSVETEKKAEKSAAGPRKVRRRSCPGGYVLHSNEFKLAALRRLDEVQNVAKVAAELGLKSANSLLYWQRIREKLVVAEKKRFRLSGGGRHSSCSFEGELLAWVSERQQSGQEASVKAVLEYLRQFHASFVEGKKEATLRKWVLRFFKRCWRPASSSESTRDGDKAHIFV